MTDRIVQKLKPSFQLEALSVKKKIMQTDAKKKL